MITNHKKHKDVKFHKVKSQIFNNVKKYNKNKSSNEMAFLHYSPSIKRMLRKSTRSSALGQLLKNVEEQYSILDNKNFFKPSKKVKSSNQINILSKIFLGPKEKEKNIRNIGKENISIYLKHKEKKLKEKKDISSKSIQMCKTFVINNNSKYKNNKLDNKIININENDKNNSYVINNKSIKYKRRKNEENNEEKYNDEIHDKERKENLGKTIKRKFLCCL